MRHACLFFLVACSNVEETSQTSATSSTITTPTVTEGDCELQTNNALRIDCNFSHLEGTNATVTTTAGTTTRSFIVGGGLTSVWGLQESFDLKCKICKEIQSNLYNFIRSRSRDLVLMVLNYPKDFLVSWYIP